MKKQLLTVTLIISVLAFFSSHRGMAQAVQLPFTEDFESYEDTEDFLENSGWTTIDADGDGNNWILHYDDFDDIRLMVSHSHLNNDALTPENFLVTPRLALPELKSGAAVMLTYHVAASGRNFFNEKYKVVVTAAEATVEGFAEGTVVFEETLTEEESDWRFTSREIDLSAFAGEELYIAFVHYDCTDQDRLLINEVKVQVAMPPGLALPFAEDFESYEDTEDFLENSGWTTIDADGDGNNWILHYDDFDDIRLMISHSHLNNDALTPENYLVAPRLAIPELDAGAAVVLTYDVAASGRNYFSEKYKVVVSAAAATLDDFAEGTVVFEETLTEEESDWRFAKREVDLSAFAGQEVFLAFVHYDCSDQDRLLLNNVLVEMVLPVDHDLPFVENFQAFEDTETFFSETEWTTIDADGDGNDWFLSELDGVRYMASESWADGALEPENYLITPQIQLPADPANAFILLSYDIAATGNNFFTEHYKVVVSTMGNEQEDFTDDHIVFEETLTEAERGRRWARRHMDLAAYAGEAVYIAFVHYDCSDNDKLILNNVAVRLINSATVAPEMVVFNPMDPVDLSTTIYWFGATEVSKINDGSRDLIPDTDYNISVAGEDTAALTFMADYLSTAPEGLLQLTIHFDTGSPAVFEIDVARIPENAVIEPGMVDFDPQNPANVTVNISWGDATGVTAVSVGDDNLDEAMYAVSGDQLTVMAGYFEDMEPGYVSLHVEFDEGEPASFVVRVFDHTIRSLPFAEDFMGLPELGANTPEEWLPNGWRAVDANQDGHNWYWVPVNVDGVFSYGRMQSRSAVQVDGQWQPLTPDNWLITPPIKLNQIMAADQTIELTLHVAPGASTPGFRLESYEVLISYTDLDPASFDELYRETISEDHPQNALLERSVELSFYEGQDVYIAFRHHGSSDMDRLLFSNVKVVFHGDDTSVQDPALSQIRVFPNPVSTQLTITAVNQIRQIEMIGLLGQVVHRQDVHDTHVQINVTSIPEGIYFLRAHTDDGTIVRRVQVIR